MSRPTPWPKPLLLSLALMLALGTTLTLTAAHASQAPVSLPRNAPALGKENTSYALALDRWVQEARLTGSDGAAGDSLGSALSVSADGSIVVIGAPDATVGGHAGQGAVYVFVKPNGPWATTSSFTAKMTASDGAANDSFGSAVAISRDGLTIVVGAPFAKIGSNSHQGAAYVFVYTLVGTHFSYVQSAKLSASDGLSLDYFGTSASINGDGSQIVVGALNLNGGPAGAAYVFTRQAGAWADQTERQKLTASDGALNDDFGRAVSLSTDALTIVVGAPGATIGGYTSEGAAYVFVYTSVGLQTKYLELAKLTASDVPAGNLLGESVSINDDGTTIAVGGNYGNLRPFPRSATYLFVKPVAGWATTVESAKLTTVDTDGPNPSVAISSNGLIIIMGLPQAHVGNNSMQGAAYAFVKPAGGWTSIPPSAKLTALDGTAGDNFGGAVSASNDGSTIAIGSRFATVAGNTSQGAAYVFVKGFGLFLPLITR